MDVKKFQDEDQILFDAIEAYKNGKKNQATHIYESTKKYTYRIIHQDVERFKSQSLLTGDVNATTEDVMQDLYLNFFNNIDKFRNEDPKSIYKWISIVSHRMVLAYVDKNKMEVLQFEKDEDFREENDIWDSSEISDSDIESNHEMLPEEALEDKEFQQLILDFIQSLPEAQAQTVLLHFRGGMKYQEIADEMGVSLITVKTRMKKAKDSLEEVIAKYEEKTGTKLHSISILPLLWLFYRMSAESTTVPARVGTAILTTKGVVFAGAKMMLVKKMIGIAAVVLTLGIGSVIGIQSLLPEKEPHAEQGNQGEQDEEERHYLVWQGKQTDITEYIYKSEYVSTPDGTFGGVCLASDEVLLKMGFEKTIDESQNPSYKYGDLNIIYYMGTDKFGISSEEGIDIYTYGTTFPEKDGICYVDIRLALRVLVIDEYVGTGVFGEYLISDNAEETGTKIIEKERVKKYAKQEINVQKGIENADDILGSLKQNDCVMQIGIEDSWSKILYKGFIGYVKREDLIENITEDKKEVPETPEIVFSQEQIEAKRAFNQAYRDFLNVAKENMYGFDVIDANADGIPEVMVDFDGASNGGPADMYTYREWDGDVSYAGKGAGALLNMEYCDKTGYVLGKIPGEYEGKIIYDVLIYNYSTGWLNPGPRLNQDQEGKYYEYQDGTMVPVSDEKENEIKTMLQTYFPYTRKPTVQYQVTDAVLNKFFPIDDAGIIKQLLK